MPELPEVETVVRDLRPQLTGRRLIAIHSSKAQLRRHWPIRAIRHLIQARIASLHRRGKWIVVLCDDGQGIRFHLGMTGQLTVVPGSEPLPDHLHWWAELDNGYQWRFRDIRRFGSVEWFAHGQEALAELDRKLGPEPLNLPSGHLKAVAAQSQRCLKAVLLDQTIIAGVGNIYADEALFEAALHPARLARSLQTSEWDRLQRAVRRVLRRAIAARGSTIRNYVGGSGLQGRYQQRLNVYGREGLPCFHCGHPIVRQYLAGRSTHYCAYCQR